MHLIRSDHGVGSEREIADEAEYLATLRTEFDVALPCMPRNTSNSGAPRANASAYRVGRPPGRWRPGVAGLVGCRFACSGSMLGVNLSGLYVQARPPP